jgi:hypothetical protein
LLDDRGGVHRQDECRSVAWIREADHRITLNVALAYCLGPRAKAAVHLRAIPTQEGYSLIERIGEGDSSVFTNATGRSPIARVTPTFSPRGAVQVQYAQFTVAVPDSPGPESFREAYSSTARALNECFESAPSTRGAFAGALNEYLAAQEGRLASGQRTLAADFAAYGASHWEALASQGGGPAP